MRGVYTAHIEITSLSIAKSVLVGVCPSLVGIEILHADLTDLSVSTAEQLRIALSRITTIGTPVSAGGAVIDLQKSEVGSPTTALTWYGDCTTEPTTYDASPIDAQGVVNVAGYYYDPIFEVRPIITAGKSFGLRLISAPTTAFRCSAQITYREIGG